MNLIVMTLDLSALLFLIMIGVGLLFSLGLNMQYVVPIAVACMTYLAIRIVAYLISR